MTFPPSDIIVALNSAPAGLDPNALLLFTALVALAVATYFGSGGNDQ